MRAEACECGAAIRLSENARTGKFDEEVWEAWERSHADHEKVSMEEARNLRESEKKNRDRRELAAYRKLQ